MKAKIIKKLLNKKFNHFLDSIGDEKVKALLKENTIITGGSIVSLLQNEKPNDYDCYMRTKEATVAVAQYYVDLFKKNNPDNMTFRNSAQPVQLEVRVDKDDRVAIFAKSAGVMSEGDMEETYEFFELGDPGSPEQDHFIDEAISVFKDSKKGRKTDGEYRPIFMTSNAITLSQDMQIVIRFFGEPDEIHKNYDFVHCTCHWTSWDNKLVLPAKALEAILTKELIYVGSLYPLCSVIRIRKFIKKGWTCNAGQILKMAMQLHDIDLHDPKVLKEQLIGVDVAYFFDLLDKLRAENPEHIDTNYVMSIVDEIF